MHPKSCTLIYTGRGLKLIQSINIPILSFYNIGGKKYMSSPRTVESEGEGVQERTERRQN